MFYRDGVGESQTNFIFEYEIQNLRDYVSCMKSTTEQVNKIG